MNRHNDPAELAATVRLAELGGLLALGYARHVASREKDLDASPPVGACCEASVHAAENTSATAAVAPSAATQRGVA